MDARVDRLVHAVALVVAGIGLTGEAPPPMPSRPALPAEPAEGSAAPTTAAATAEIPSARPSAAAPPPTAPAACPGDMVEILGDHCATLDQECTRKRKPWQCAEFKAPSVCRGAEARMHYCIDRYEYPNVRGEKPKVMMSYWDAKRICKDLGKRMCKSREWTLACEGPDRLPFPYGYVRDATACNIDKDSPMQDENKLFWPKTQQAELARLDQREPSGARETCKSAYGVYDLTGSVDEWTVNESGVPYAGALKGGNWGEYRNACRPATLGHDEGFHYYQTGFRCCLDAR